jgi:C-terminal processing protease CtpA/Prc
MTFLVDSNGDIIENLGIFGVAKNSPAYKAGIQAGDVVTAGKIGDNEYTQFKNNGDLKAFLQNIEIDQPFFLRITREGEFIDKEVQLERRNYICAMVVYKDNKHSLDFTYGDEQEETISESGKMENLADDTAYIQLDEFTGKAADEFARAMEFMKECGKTKLILDLRNNVGGLVTEMCKIASYLVYNNGAKKTPLGCSQSDYDEIRYVTSKNNFNTEIQKITVLANGYTASASESLLGAMLHYGDAFSIDNLILTSFNRSRNNYSTFGKGIVQRTYELNDGSAIKLTRARIYWPDYKTCIQDVGIVQNNKDNCVSDEFAIDRAIEILK